MSKTEQTADAAPKPVHAEVIKPFAGVPDGKHDAVDFAEGDKITGDLARAMIAAGYAKAVKG